MPIAGMDSANSPGITSYTLLIGEDLPLYFTAAGFFGGSANGSVFGIPPQSSIPRGTLWIEAVPNAAPGGTGAISLALQASFDGGTTFQILATGTAQAAWTAGVGTILKFDISGLGGSGQLRLVSSGVTLGTATGFNIYAHLG
jgi:hypothetical protein